MLLRVSRQFLSLPRYFGQQQLSQAEEKLAKLLRERFPKASIIEVADVSGGCGSMYKVAVESNEFKGLTKVAQHKLITACLAKEIKDMHGLIINTTISK